jgi:hypothetical protein
MELKNYVNEIIDIAEANNMEWDEGKDMFLANIRNSHVIGAPYYPGAFVDYPALYPELEAMTNEEVADMKNDFDDWYRANMEEIIRARKAVENI